MERSLPEIQIIDGDSLDKAAAKTITSIAQEAVADRGICHLVLSGGGTPAPLYKLMSMQAYQELFPWERTHIYWGDERNVPVGDPGSNYGQAQEILLSRVPLVPAHVHRMRGELPPEESAVHYRRELLEMAVGELPWPRFDIVLLGLGSDGHTASLFPGKINPQEHSAPVIAVQAEYEDRPANRITLTPLILNDARTIIFMVKGAQKANAVFSIIRGSEDLEQWPAQRIKPASGQILWFLDQPAASRL